MDLENTTTSQKRTKSLVGWISFGLLFLGVAILVYLGVTGLLAYKNRSLGTIDVGHLITLVKVICVLSVSSVIIAMVTFFLPRQKKGIGVFSLIMALVLIFISGAVLYGYEYVFGTLEYDEEFSELKNEELYMPPVKEDGTIDFKEEIVVETQPQAVVEEQFLTQELEWESLSAADVPEGAQPYVEQQAPARNGILLPEAAQIENFIVFGLDRAQSSDSMILISMDRIHKKIKMISLARDTYVKIPEWGSYTKLNYAYNAGQEKTAVGTINYNFKLNIKDYVTVNFADVATMIDMVGGVDIELDWYEMNYLNVYGFYGVWEGMNRLDGKEALCYSRMRDSSPWDNEIARTGRQREVLMALFQNAKSMPHGMYPDLVRAAMDLCKTSLAREKILTMLLRAVSDGYTIENYALINEVEYWGGQFGPSNYFYLVYDLDLAGDTLYRIIYEDLYISGYDREDVE